MKQTLFDKIWDAHKVMEIPEGPDVLYIDRHLIHEVTSPQAFNALRAKGMKVFRPERTFATCDHNTPTLHQDMPIEDPASAEAVSALARNTEENGIRYFPLGDPGNGIVHVMGPEQGIVLCGQTVVCGDSHTATHGAFGNIAFGIGTSEVEMVFATQCLMQTKPRQARITVDGRLRPGVTPKDVILYIISRLGTGGCTGCFVEYAGEVFGMVAPDETTFRYISGRRFAPSGEDFTRSVERWRQLYTDDDAVFDKEYRFDAADIPPMMTYGTNPGMGMPVDAVIPESAVGCDSASFDKALAYMGFHKGQSLLGFKVDYVFLGSCTNGRIEDFRAFASAVKGRHKADGVTVWLVPGSKQVEKMIEDEGIGDILREAGFELRQPGCSACLAMNADKIPEGRYAVSTSNRNFEGRQGYGARTILAGPLVAAEAAVTGCISLPQHTVC